MRNLLPCAHPGCNSCVWANADSTLCGHSTIAESGAAAGSRRPCTCSGTTHSQDCAKPIAASSSRHRRRFATLFARPARAQWTAPLTAEVSLFFAQTCTSCASRFPKCARSTPPWGGRAPCRAPLSDSMCTHVVLVHASKCRGLHSGGGDVYDQFAILTSSDAPRHMVSSS